VTDSPKTYAFGKDDFAVPQLADIKVATEPDGEGGLRYLVRARFNMNTPLGQILPFLENGGSIRLKTKTGEVKQLLLESVSEESDGSTRS
jgi:hypothetical protein